MLTVGAAARGSSRRPQVHVVDGRVLVYDPASAATLLSEHRIWPTPVGVRRARNNSPEHNFPCVLSQEQATLVLRRRLADALYPRHSSASGAGCDHHETLRQRHSDDGDGGAEEQEEAKLLMTTKKACYGPPRLFDSEWRFPETAVEKKSMAVFEDLWAKGLCAVSGSNYAADFVVYNGPPTECHSVAAVMISRGASDELSPAEVSGFARVQQAVGKRAVIATAPLATSDTSPVVVGESTLASATAAAAAVVASRDGERGPTGVEGRTTAPRRHAVGKEAALGTVSATALEEAPTPAPAAVDAAAAAEAAAAEAAAANDGVRYITLQFHSVSSRV